MPIDWRGTKEWRIASGRANGRSHWIWFTATVDTLLQLHLCCAVLVQGRFIEILVIDARSGCNIAC